MKKKKSDATEMPIGLMMSLAMNRKAMRNFSLLPDEKQKSVVRYIEASQTGAEAKNRIHTAVDSLEQGNTGFIG
mgnify:CR=1 FL=1